MEVEIEGIYKDCFRIFWSSEKGFGTIDIYRNKDGEFIIDNETMPRSFIKEVFCAIIDSLPIKD